MVRGVASAGNAAFLYHFAKISPKWPKFGAAHAAEIAFAFNDLGEKHHTPGNVARMEAMHAYWIRFATTGDPNREGLPQWPRYDAQNDQHVVLNNTIEPGARCRTQACDLFARS